MAASGRGLLNLSPHPSLPLPLPGIGKEFSCARDCWKDRARAQKGLAQRTEHPETPSLAPLLACQQNPRSSRSGGTGEGEGRGAQAGQAWGFLSPAPAPLTYEECRPGLDVVVAAVQVAEGLRQVDAELLPAVAHLGSTSLSLAGARVGTWRPASHPLPAAGPHQAAPEEVAGAEALLPGQRTEEGVLRPPVEQHGAAVEGKLGLLRDGREGRAWAAVPRKLPVLPGCFLLPSGYTLSPPASLASTTAPWAEGSVQSPPAWKLAACLSPQWPGAAGRLSMS